MSIKPPLALLLFALEALRASAQPVSERDVQVDTTVAPASARLVAEVHRHARADRSIVIEVRLTNRSDRAVDLLDAEVRFPWNVAPGPDAKVAAGATATGRWPPLLVSDAANARGDPTSGMYLLAQRGTEYALAAFVSWQTFWSKLRYGAGVLTMTADGEGRRIRPGETVGLEKIRLTTGSDWQELLFDYADAIARELPLTPKPARGFVGWSTWDYYGRGWTTAEVTGNLDALQQLVPQANLLQLDGGWWSERGDFTEARADLGADGMKRLAAEIRGRGLVAGIHLDGMRASERSAVARDHPEFFLHDDRGALLVEKNGAGGDGPYVFFDYSNPAACDYLRTALHRLRCDWGFDYFKIDYLRAGIGEDLRQHALNNDPRRAIIPFDRGLTSVERFHRALTAFREGMGDDAYFLGCSTPFGPALGHVDGLRTGPDISPAFASYRNQCEANGGNFYLNGTVAQIDADYEVVRAKQDQDARRVNDPGKDGGALSLAEAEMWTDYVALFGGTKLASDDLMILRDERKELVRFAATQPACARFVPLDFWAHGRTRTDACHVFLGVCAHDVFLALFNWTDASHAYLVRGARPGELQPGGLVRGAAEAETSDRGTTIKLAAHHAAIFRLPTGTDFDRVRTRLVVD